MYVIEKGVPCPSNDTRGPKRNDESFYGTVRRMDVGDSFFAPGKKISVAGCAPSVLRARGQVPSTFITVMRTVNENGVQGVRIWRIA